MLRDTRAFHSQLPFRLRRWYLVQALRTIEVGTALSISSKSMPCTISVNSGHESLVPITLKHLPPEFQMWMGGFMLMSCLWLLMLKGQMDLLCAVMVFGVLLLVSLREQAAAALLTLAFFSLLGDTRRIVASFGQPALDLLLLVRPGASLLCCYVLVLLKVRLSDRLSSAQYSLSLWLYGLGIVQSSTRRGLCRAIWRALLHHGSPLWLWVGRELASPAVVGASRLRRPPPPGHGSSCAWFV